MGLWGRASLQNTWGIYIPSLKDLSNDPSKLGRKGRVNRDGTNPSLPLTCYLPLTISQPHFLTDQWIWGPCMFWPQLFPLLPYLLLLFPLECCSSRSVCLLVFLQTCSCLEAFSPALLSVGNDLPQRSLTWPRLTLYPCLSFLPNTHEII